MKITINSLNNKHLETISLENLNNINETFQRISFIKKPLKAEIFILNESISSHQLLKYKNNLNKVNVCSLSIYSNNRNTIIAGKSLQINSTFVSEKDIKNKLILLDSKKQDDILHEGTVRSGDRISSDGNLCIIGDVNPGAIV